ERTKEDGRSPTIQELSDYLQIPQEELLLAQEAVLTPTSIHETVYENDGDPITLMDQISDQDHDNWFEKIALKDAIENLDERERLIVYLRYYKDQTQSEVANRLGIPKCKYPVSKRKF